jgi:hypothetical protein
MKETMMKDKNRDPGDVDANDAIDNTMIGDTAWRCRVTCWWAFHACAFARFYFGCCWVCMHTLVWYVGIWGVGRIEFEWDALDVRLY